MPTPSFTLPVSQLAQGVVGTISGLRAISNVTMTDGATVTTLGSGYINDGYAATYFYSGACALSDNGISIIAAGTTGSWIRIGPVPYIPTTVQTSSYSGIGENFVLLSGGATQIIYTLPPSYTILGQQLTVKSLSTGAFQIRATGLDFIFPNTGVSTVQTINLQATGLIYNPNTATFRAGAGIYYQF